jgi:hypothetical protein
MKFKVDENLPVELVDDLRSLGHDAQSVLDEGATGATDSAILATIRTEGRVLLTMDKGIADVRFRSLEDYAGIVLFRPATSGRGAVTSFARRHLPYLLQADICGRLMVITGSSIRIR